MNAAVDRSSASATLRTYLDEQQAFTAVEIFARAHDHGSLAREQPRYRALLPSHGPSAGEQYAFEVDLDRCSGCKACVTGCHSRNGLDSEEIWRSVGLTLGGDDRAPVVQHVTSACHHCADPACLSGCPVRAYEKDTITGIVRHLDDQCIGCQYCVMKCPYGVPQYNAERGIVRKCDLCTDRLAVGEAPACVQSCPNEAIRITLVDTERDIAASREGFAVVAGAPDAAYTRPTTRYVSRLTGAVPAVAVERPLEPGESHPSLVVMLTLTQAAAGLVVLAAMTSAAVGGAAVVASLALAVAGMVAATTHLGRPTWAFRAVLGLRTSWLSREIVALGGFTGLLVASLTSIVLLPELLSSLLPLAGSLGLVAVYCSAMVYEDTPRPYWATRRTFVRFLLSSAASGSVLFAAVSTVTVGLQPAFVALAIVAIVVRLLFELADVRRPRAATAESVRLLRGVLLPVRQLRLAIAALSVALLVASLIASPHLAVPAAFAWLASEGVERHLFFRAAVAPRMP